jgi:hypothetical protein
MRERGQPFFFLPMFGFADETAIVQPATQAMDALIAETGDMGTSVYDLAHSKGVPAVVTKAMLLMQDRITALEAENYKTFTDGLEAAAQICGSLAETTYDDADAFEAATGCEAAIMRVVKDQRKEQSGAIERGEHKEQG